MQWGCEIEAKPKLYASNGSPSVWVSGRTPESATFRISQRLYSSVNGATAESTALPLVYGSSGLVNGSTFQSTALRLSQRPYSSVNGRTLFAPVSFEIKFERQKKVFAMYERGELLRRLRTPRFVLGRLRAAEGLREATVSSAVGSRFPGLLLKPKAKILRVANRGGATKVKSRS